MAMFNSYVQLPEGINEHDCFNNGFFMDFFDSLQSTLHRVGPSDPTYKGWKLCRWWHWHLGISCIVAAWIADPLWDIWIYIYILIYVYTHHIFFWAIFGISADQLSAYQAGSEESSYEGGRRCQGQEIGSCGSGSFRMFQIPPGKHT